MACIDSRMLSTTVASQCQTPRELLAVQITSKRIQIAQPINFSSIAHEQFTKGLHFSAFHYLEVPLQCVLLRDSYLALEVNKSPSSDHLLYHFQSAPE